MLTVLGIVARCAVPVRLLSASSVVRDCVTILRDWAQKQRRDRLWYAIDSGMLGFWRFDMGCTTGNGKGARGANTDLWSSWLRFAAIGLLDIRCYACNAITLVSPSEMRSPIAVSLVLDSHRVCRP